MTNTHITAATAVLMAVAALTACGPGADSRQPRKTFIQEVRLTATPVKDQGRSPLCWVYAVLATIEPVVGALLGWLVQEGDQAGAAFLLRTVKLSDAALSDACGLARNLGRTETVALLLEEQHKRAPAGKGRRFEL